MNRFVKAINILKEDVTMEQNKLYLFGSYGKQKVNGVSCLKCNSIVSIALEHLGLKCIKSASYRYYDVSTLKTSYDFIYIGSNRRKYLVIETPRATEIFNLLQQHIKNTNQEYISEWIQVKQ